MRDQSLSICTFKNEKSNLNPFEVKMATFHVYKFHFTKWSVAQAETGQAKFFFERQPGKYTWSL